ncbi:MAG: adenylate/guanylate cyclase domain-containing protein [Actinomycetaceae bacterium]|nr:adenylate/guanylate cyclase domain-containing protein [Actinomycetaceae bacterium]
MHTPDTSEASSTVSFYRQMLAGGEPTLTAQEVAEMTESPLSRVENYWISMGFYVQSPTEKIFTAEDLRSYQRWSDLIDSGRCDMKTAMSLIRAQSHITDRLVLWQIEAFVDDAARRFQLDDIAARLTTLDRLREFIPMLEKELLHCWRRQLESMITRLDSENSHLGIEVESRKFPLLRTFGFVDMVSYTSTSAQSSQKDLISLINEFEDVSRVAITASGGRVVKMIGDAVFYIADDLPTGLEVVTNLMRKLTSIKGMLPVRASVVQGEVFSRSGDVYGPSVNLASRLVDVALPGTILTDADTAERISKQQAGRQYRVSPSAEAELRGVGRVRPFLVTRTDREDGEVSSLPTI